jgi:hypothetical protein
MNYIINISMNNMSMNEESMEGAEGSMTGSKRKKI